MNRPVIIYGAGFRGGRNFIALAEENVHVEAFCDRDAEHIPLYYGCNVLTRDEAVEKYPSLPFLLSVDDEEARRQIAEDLRTLGIEVYESFEEFFQGQNDYEIEHVYCGKAVGFQVVPSLLEGREHLTAYSFGIGFDYSFELELAEKYGMEVYAFDPSPEVVKEMESKKLPENLRYYPYGLSDEDALKTFYLPSSGLDYSEHFAPWTSSEKIQMQVHRLSTLMERFGHSRLDLLKMDVEGSEFMALPDILESGLEFDQLCIETHTRIFPDSVEKMRGVKKLLNDHGYLLVSNGRQEQTYISKRAGRGGGYGTGTGDH
ncbi:FkbM family methyltransferase [Dorea sp. 5-2]|nr:FkbM family methyltransferase [Dorea sp. 5-2]